MSRLARKVTPGKWQGAPWAGVDAIPADAFWDLKTSNNTLSFWRADNGRLNASNRSTETIAAPGRDTEIEAGDVGNPSAVQCKPKPGLVSRVWHYAQRWWQNQSDSSRAEMTTETGLSGKNVYIGEVPSGTVESATPAPSAPVVSNPQAGAGGKTKPNKPELSPDEETAVTALLGTLERLDKIDIVFIEEGDLSSHKVEAPGGTFMRGYAELHVDLSDLQHQSLVETASAIGKQIYGKRVTRLTRAEVERRIREAHQKGIVDVGSMHASIRAELRL